jgi:hypothetical protein
LPNTLGRVASASFIVAPFGFVSFQQAWADDAQNRLVPVQGNTIPGNGDLNPYGVAFVPPGFPSGGLLIPGWTIVSTFSAGSNKQGTGTTIDDTALGPRRSRKCRGGFIETQPRSDQVRRFMGGSNKRILGRFVQFCTLSIPKAPDYPITAA